MARERRKEQNKEQVQVQQPIDAEARRMRLKNLIVLGKERGYLTYAEINDHLPDDMLDAEQIENIISMINDMGIHVYDEAGAVGDAYGLVVNAVEFDNLTVMVGKQRDFGGEHILGPVVQAGDEIRADADDQCVLFGELAALLGVVGQLFRAAGGELERPDERTRAKVDNCNAALQRRVLLLDRQSADILARAVPVKDVGAATQLWDQLWTDFKGQ